MNERERVSIEQVVEAEKELNAANLKISRLLYEASKNECYIHWGFKSMSDFVRHATDLDEQTAQEFGRIGKFIVTNELPDEKLLEIGWKKLSLIAAVSVSK